VHVVYSLYVCTVRYTSHPPIAQGSAAVGCKVFRIAAGLYMHVHVCMHTKSNVCKAFALLHACMNAFQHVRHDVVSAQRALYWY
jgi:hypothetical protein